MPVRTEGYLDTDTVTVADGAWGTELDRLGCGPGCCREEWNVTHPDLVQKIGEAYVAAGARIILTNTFGANRYILGRHDRADGVKEFNKAGAAISQRASGDKARVFGSLGPSGKIIMMGEVNEGELYEAFKEQAEALAEGGADGLVIESMTELAEAVTAVKAARTTGLPVVGCMTFASGKDRINTMMGVTPEKAALALTDAGADMVGCNCGIGIDRYIKVAGLLGAATRKPIWVKASAGLPEIEGGKIVYRVSAEEFAEKAKEVVKAGASVIGGCCGTTPDFIRALVAALS
jgi:5-methyltetrahydrofolate--homocysteine methyltransferase